LTEKRPGIKSKRGGEVTTNKDGAGREMRKSVLPCGAPIVQMGK